MDEPFDFDGSEISDLDVSGIPEFAVIKDEAAASLAFADGFVLITVEASLRDDGSEEQQIKLHTAAMGITHPLFLAQAASALSDQVVRFTAMLCGTRVEETTDDG